MNKGAISTIVATVLIVLITVAAVTLLWGAISPLITDTIFLEDVNLRLFIQKESGYTFYDKDNGYLSVRMGRGSDDAEIIALKFVVEVLGESRIIKKYNVLGTNQVKLYKFGIGFFDEIISLKVVPIYLLDGDEREGGYFVYDYDIPVRSSGFGSGDVGDWDDVSCLSGYDGILSDGLVIYYTFEDTSGDYIFDYSCNGHNGLAKGDAGYFDDSVRGRVFELDGDGDYVEFGETEKLGTRTGGNKTIAFWAKTECATSYSIVFGSVTNYYIGFLIECGGLNSPLFYTIGSPTPLFYTSGPVVPFSLEPELAQGEWHYYLFTVEENMGGSNNYFNISLYVDRSFVISDLFEMNAWTDNNFYFGTTANSDGDPILENSLKGLIDEFRIYNRTLSVEEIGELYIASGGL